MLHTTLTELKKKTAQGVALVDFDVPWCASSHIQERIIEALARRFPKNVWMAAVDVDRIRDMAITFDIHHVPTLVLFKEGREVRRFIGLQSEETLGSAIETLLRS